jgi:hypothetical protein
MIANRPATTLDRRLSVEETCREVGVSDKVGSTVPPTVPCVAEAGEWLALEPARSPAR